jgi:hypothetical protein
MLFDLVYPHSLQYHIRSRSCKTIRNHLNKSICNSNILLLPSLGWLRRLRFDCVELRHFLRIAFSTYATNNSIELDNGEGMKNGGGGGHGGAGGEAGHGGGGGGHSVVVEFGMMLLALCLPWPSLERKSAWLSS